MGQVLGLHGWPWSWRWRWRDSDQTLDENQEAETAAPMSAPAAHSDWPLYVAEIYANSIAVRSEERRERELAHAWCVAHMSPNMYVKEEDPLTIHRTPVAQSTDGARLKRGFSRGVHIFEIVWPAELRGTHAAVGVCTSGMCLQSNGYLALVGGDEHSWGWDIVNQRLLHGGVLFSPYPVSQKGGSEMAKLDVPTKILLILDMDEGTLAFASADQRYYGIAFQGLAGLLLYPVISAVWGHCEVTMRYIGNIGDDCPPLLQLSRHKVREVLGRDRLSCEIVDLLPIPAALKSYVSCAAAARAASV